MLIILNIAKKLKAVDTIPQTKPIFAEEHISPPVSFLLRYAKITAVIPNANQPIKKLVIPAILDQVASCGSSSS